MAADTKQEPQDSSAPFTGANRPQGSHRLARACAALALLLAAGGAHSAGTFLKIATDQNAPLAYVSDAGVFEGLAVEALRQAAVLADVSLEFQQLPWPRAFATYGKESNSCLIGMGRTREREMNYLWVGPFVRGGIALFALPERKLKVRTADDVIKQGLSVGVAKNDVAAAVVERVGITKTEPLSLQKFGPKMLQRARFDLWASGAILARYRAKEDGVPITEALMLEEVDVSLGCAPSSDTAALARLQAGLDAMKKSGALRALQAKYLDLPAVVAQTGKAGKATKP